MSDLARLRECGAVLRELSRRVEADCSGIEASSAALQHVADAMEPLLAHTSAIGEDRRQALTEHLLNANLHLARGTRDLLKGQIQLATLLMAPELGGD